MIPAPVGAILLALALVAGAPAVRTPPPSVAPDYSWARCAEWMPLVVEVGWPESEIATVDYVMWRESRCTEGAVGSIAVRGKRALGLMQLLGWSCPPAGCLDARSNLKKALELWQGSGWRPWCLDGDPVTGRC